MNIFYLWVWVWVWVWVGKEEGGIGINGLGMDWRLGGLGLEIWRFGRGED